MTETELMPRLVVGYTELGGSKWKNWKGFLKPNFGVGPNWVGFGVRYDGCVGFIYTFCLRLARHRAGVLPLQRRNARMKDRASA